jgi:leucyl/phenylalanyl-tRNA--protein transferase
MMAGMSPREPLPSRYRMPDPQRALANGLVAAGGDLAPGTVLAAYRSGIFPWPDQSGRLFWWSPDPRAILPLDAFHQSKRLARRRRSGGFSVSADRACADVIDGCGDRSEGTWITPAMRAAYLELHELGWVHSIEVWQEDRLVGGLYGVAVGGFFAAESMFHKATDASKIALAELVEHLGRARFSLLDVQFLTPHLSSLGATAIARGEYLARLSAAIAMDACF